MRIRIRFLAQARQVAGCDEVVLELQEGATARDAIREVTAQRGENLLCFLMHGGKWRKSILFAIGPRQVDEDAEEPLHDGDCLTILPPIAGG